MFRLFLRKPIYSCKLYNVPIQEFSSQKTISKYGNQDCFSVEYLMKKYGISMNKAVKGNKVVSFFKNEGFSETQIQNLIEYYPGVLTCKVESTLLPKIEFFRSKGASTLYLARIITFGYQTILKRSLEKHIVPSFNFLEKFVGSGEDVVFALQSRHMILQQIHSHVKPNIAVLSGAGMPRNRIAYLLKNRPSLFLESLGKLKERVKVVQDMGIDPGSSKFSLCLYVLSAAKESRWIEKMEAYKRWGCSEDEVLTSFKKQPWIMLISVGKIHAVMSFFVHEIGWESSEVVRMYFMLPQSLNKRLIPRWSVFRELLSKGLVKRDKREVTVKALFQMNEDTFCEKYVNPYKNEFPLLLKLYHEKLGASSDGIRNSTNL